jgi:hypothetical protein
MYGKVETDGAAVQTICDGEREMLLSRRSYSEEASEFQGKHERAEAWFVLAKDEGVYAGDTGRSESDE